MFEAMLQNNVLHAKKLLDLLTELPPKEYFCVSTDKTANPVNIMGRAIGRFSSRSLRMNRCNSDAEAIKKAVDLKNGSNMYPVFQCQIHQARSFMRSFYRCGNR